MSKNLIFIFLILFIVNCSIELNEISNQLDDVSGNKVETGISKNYSIEYKKETTFNFEIEDEDIYQVNIHSINCNFEIDSKGQILNQINLDTYSLQMNKENKTITIKPLIDIIDGKEKENYGYKRCHLSINSINKNQPEVKIENGQDSIFYFESEDSNSLNILYEIKEITMDSFAALFFQFNEKSDFSINVTTNNDTDKINLLHKNIYNSTYIYLNSDILEKALTNNSNISLNIIINKNDNKNISIYFKIVEKEMISMLQKDALNYGFITTETTYQYFYLEVFKEEEGEIMLHNKRFYGELTAKIINKDEIDTKDLFNSSIYPIDTLNDTNLTNITNITNLNYNPHNLKLSYNYKNTSNCDKGCYILITYKQVKSEGDYPIIGYEFTLLSRSWTISDFTSKVVDIPFNEYALGAFEKDSITHHFYSVPIPDDADKIIIQIEGNYIDCFVGEGRKAINTMKIRDNDRNLQIINNQNVITLNVKDLNFKDKAISFAFRSKDYFADIFSFYYFRVLYAQKDKILYFPLDSQLGNICIPEKDNNTNLCHCHLMFTNNFNELSTKFSVTSSNQGEYFKIYLTKVYKNGTYYNDSTDYIYIHDIDNKENEIEYYFFTFEFQNEEIKGIISSFSERVEYYYPQIYSTQMFYLIGSIKKCFYKVVNNYTLVYQYIYGSSDITGAVEVSFLNYNEFYTGRNFRGKPFVLDIDSNTKNINYRITSGKELVFSFKLEYNMRNKGIIELKSGEARSQLMERGSFPLYYYLKIKYENFIKLDVNLRLNSYDDSILKNNFDIKGYLLDEETIKRVINGEYIQLRNPINGTYSNRFKIGFLEIYQNKEYKNNENYLLIQISNNEVSRINSYLLIEFITKEHYQDVYYMPINQYIIETFDHINGTVRNKNKYQINVKQRDIGQIYLEMSPEYNDIDILFTNGENENGYKCTSRKIDCKYKQVTGFKKYIIYSSKEDSIYFYVNNPKNRTANYMIRYYFGNKERANTYEFDTNYEQQYIDQDNDEYVTLSLTFNSIKIFQEDLEVDTSVKIYFLITGLLYNKNDNSEELINTTALLHEKKPLYTNQTIHVYDKIKREKITLIFKDIERINNFVYDLQIQANVFIENNIFNQEFLVFTAEVNLTDIKKEEPKSILWYVLGPILGFILLLLIAFFAIKYFRLKKANLNLKEDLKSMAYSNDIQKNVINKERENAQRDFDYDSTFI